MPTPRKNAAFGRVIAKNHAGDDAKRAANTSQAASKRTRKTRRSGAGIAAQRETARAPEHEAVKATTETDVIGEVATRPSATAPTAAEPNATSTADAGPVVSKTRKAKIALDAPAEPRPQTKQATLIAMLQRREGATIAELAAATGWQHHSVRGAMSYALKKQLGLAITSEVLKDRGRVYRTPAPVASKRR